MKTAPAIALVPVPSALSGLGYKAARTALISDPRICAAAMAGMAGVERQRWACDRARSAAHADHLAVVAAAVAAAVQAGRMTPQKASARLDAAIDAGRKTEFVSFDDARDQTDEYEYEAYQVSDTRFDTDTDTDALASLDAILMGATRMVTPPSLPAAHLRPCMEVVRDAALTAAGLLPSGVTLIGLVDMDHDAQVYVLRRLQRNWPATTPIPALFIAAGSAQRTMVRDDSYGVTLGPTPYLLARDHANGLPQTTYRRWQAWGRRLTRALAPQQAVDPTVDPTVDPALAMATQSAASAA